MKVEAIVNLPPPHTIRKIQSLQGKSNFLRHFLMNYAKITKGFMRLLKQDTPFVWDEIAQLAFEELKESFVVGTIIVPMRLLS